MTQLMVLMLASTVFVSGKIGLVRPQYCTTNMTVSVECGSYKSPSVEVRSVPVSSGGYFSSYVDLDVPAAMEKGTGDTAYICYEVGDNCFRQAVGYAPEAVFAERAESVKAASVECEHLVLSNVVASSGVFPSQIKVTNGIFVTNRISGAIGSVVADMLYFSSASVSNALLSKVGVVSPRYSDMTGSSAFTREINRNGRTRLSTEIAHGDETDTFTVPIERDGIAFVNAYGKMQTGFAGQTLSTSPYFGVGVRLIGLSGEQVLSLGPANMIVIDSDGLDDKTGGPRGKGNVFTIPVRKGQKLEVRSVARRGTSGDAEVNCEGWVGVRVVNFGGAK